MLNPIATGCASAPSLPAAAPVLTALAGRAAALHGLPGLQLPLFGDYLGGRNVCSVGRHVQFDPEPGK